MRQHQAEWYLHYMGPEGEERERGRKGIWRNKDWPLHDFGECINPHVQEAQQTSV